MGEFGFLESVTKNGQNITNLSYKFGINVQCGWMSSNTIRIFYTGAIMIIREYIY